MTVWYRNEPVGLNKLKTFMKNLSKSAGLTKEYTNHCIRSTTITLLNNCGFESRHIATISGHRNEASLASYCYDTSDQQKKAMSDAISVCVGHKIEPSEKITHKDAGKAIKSGDGKRGTLVAIQNTCTVTDTCTEMSDNDDAALLKCAMDMESNSNQQAVKPIFQFSGCNVTIQNHYH
ncbi:uncharacterized protein LOC134269398 [Saccostrea cucullata]|uniref:uncharacterized protein LOC134269398 n=1 Tax=Saccostrea cuccullata TaxID=36930 RepID=UPI002ED11232